MADPKSPTSVRLAVDSHRGALVTTARLVSDLALDDLLQQCGMDNFYRSVLLSDVPVVTVGYVTTVLYQVRLSISVDLWRDDLDGQHH